LRVPVT